MSWVIIRWPDQQGTQKVIGPFESEKKAQDFIDGREDHDRYVYTLTELLSQELMRWSIPDYD